MRYFISLILLLIIISYVLGKKSKAEHFTEFKSVYNKFRVNNCAPQEYIFADQVAIFKNDCFPSNSASLKNENCDKNRETFVSSSLISNNYSAIPKRVWIYYPYEKGARQWTSFGGRLNWENKPELFKLTVSKLKKNLGMTWDVVILDQTNIQDYIKLPTCLYGNELLIQAAVLNKYGGVWLPSYSYLLRDLTPLLNGADVIYPYIPGWNKVLPILSKPNQRVWREMADYILANPNKGSDYSDFNKLEQIMTGCSVVKKVSGDMLGVLDGHGNAITFLNLASDNNTYMNPSAFLVSIPREEEERRETAYLLYYNEGNLSKGELWVDRLLL